MRRRIGSAPILTDPRWRHRAGLPRAPGIMGDAGDGLGGRPGLGQMSEGPRTVWAVLGAASMALGAYHGYRRHRGSIGWAIGWALTGAFFPVITPAIAYAQGFGKPMRRNPRRR